MNLRDKLVWNWRMLILLLALICMGNAQQAIPTGYVNPIAMAGLGPNGFGNMILDLNGNLITSGATGRFNALLGYVNPFAPVALTPSGMWGYLNIDANGNLKVVGSGGGTITGVTAGTGLSGGGSSGTVTLTNTAPVPSGTQGEPLINSMGSTAYATSGTYLDCSQFSGTDVSLQIENCMVAGATLNSTAVTLDARGITANLTGTVNPFSAASSISNSGVLMMPCATVTTPVPWVAANNWTIKGCATNSSNGVNYAIGGSGVAKGSALQASSGWKTTYSTGTVSVAGAGFGEVVTGSGTSWASNVVPGCAFVAPAGGINGTSSWGIIHTVTSNTSITLGFGGKGNSDVSAGSSYDIYCPVYVHGDGYVSADVGFEYGMGAEDISFDCNNEAGCVPEMNWYGGQHTYAKDVNEYNFCGLGLDIETEYAENSGPWEKIVAGPGTCASTTVKPFMVATNSGRTILRNITTNKGNSSSKPAVGVDLEGTNIEVDGADTENVTVGIGINGNQACIPACPWPGSYAWSAASIITVNGVYGGGNTGTDVELYNTNGGPTGIDLYDMQGYGPQSLVDNVNGCTSSSEQLGAYILNAAGKVQYSSSGIANCQPNSTNLVKAGNTQLLTSDSSGITATTPGTTEWTWGSLAKSTNYSFHCSILFSQATGAGGVGVSVQSATNAATRWDAWAKLYTTNPASTTVTATLGSALDVTSTTATSIASATPGATGTVYQGELDGTIQTGSTAGTLNVLVYSGSSSDAVTVKAGSYCSLLP